MRKTRRFMASLCATGLLAAGVSAPMATAQEQDADGLVVVQLADINVTVPVQAAIGIAANVCNLDIDANILAVDQGTEEFTGGNCDARSPVFADQELTITDN